MKKKSIIYLAYKSIKLPFKQFRNYRNKKIVEKIIIDEIPYNELRIIIKKIKFIENGKRFKLKHISSIFSSYKHSFILSSLEYFYNLIHYASATIELKNERIYISIDDLKFEIKTSEEIFILNEIFIKNIYNIDLCRKSILLDIGMNVGYASIYFAKKNYISNVYGYELFRPTYMDALNNFELNPKISKKIIPNNKGIGIKDSELILDYHNDYKGHLGIHTTKNTLESKFKNFNSEKLTNEMVKLISINRVIDELAGSHKKEDIILKIDCEGCEYDVIDSLNLELKNLKYLMIEWHYKGPEKIIEKLRTFGFVCYSIYKANSDDGMIYASR